MRRSETARLRLSTPVVRRDQDGGHRSESRAQRFPFFIMLFLLFLGGRNFSRQRLVPFYRKARRRRRGMFVETQSPLKS